jgi:hypothetical protein
MTDTKDQIARLVQAAEEAAYRRGWEDACAAIKRAADTTKRSDIAPGWQAEVIVEPVEIEPRRTGRPASAAIGVVEDCITASPGKKGVEVVKAVQLVDPSIPERTVRTALRRLKIHKRIWQRNGLWYPKLPRQHDLLENHDEEAISSPPHQ